MNAERNWYLANWAVKLCRELVPFSTNLCPNIVTTEQEFLLSNVRIKTPYRKIFTPDVLASLNISPTYLSSSTNKSTTFELDGTTYSLDDIIDELTLIKDHLPKKDAILEHIENRVKNSIRFRLGNCSELTKLCCMLLIECDLKNSDGTPINIVTIQLDSFDHEFAILGAAKNADLFEPFTWGPEAIVLDPWVHETYHVDSELNEFKAPSSVFKVIRQALRTDKEINYTEWKVGQGHSDKWNKKQRPPIRYSPQFFSNASSFMPEPENNYNQRGLGYRGK